MIRNLILDFIRPVRVWAGRFVLPPKLTQENYVGRHGCLHAAASFAAWNQTEGDYPEFGVHCGDSFIAAYKSITHCRNQHISAGYDSPDYRQWQKNPPRFFAFDSFEGLPSGPAERQVDYYPGSYRCPERKFIENLAKERINLDQVVVVPGFFEQTLNCDTKARHGLRRAAIVMIDCDLYESTVPVLDFITNLVGQGTIVIFDDWFRFRGSPEHGEQRACREWLARNPQLRLIEYWREGPQAVSFLVNLR